MLVLTRKNNQKILIGDNVVLTILNVKGNTVKVGIEAPREIRVLRGELPVAPKVDTIPLSRVKEINIVYSDERSTEIMRTDFNSVLNSPAGSENRRRNLSLPSKPLPNTTLPATTLPAQQLVQGKNRLQDFVKQVTGLPIQSAPISNSIATPEPTSTTTSTS